MLSASLLGDAAPSTLQTVNLGAERLSFWLCCGAGERLGSSAGHALPYLTSKNVSRLLHPPLYRLSTTSTGPLPQRWTLRHLSDMSLHGFCSRRSACTLPIPRRGCLRKLPQAACAFTASRGLSGTDTFLPKANHFLLCQWLTLMCGTVPHFLGQVKGAMAFPMQSCDRAHYTLIFRRTMPHMRRNH